MEIEQILKQYHEKNEGKLSCKKDEPLTDAQKAAEKHQ